jgi:hypothetical protein
MVMTSASPGMGVALLPSRSLPGQPLLEGALDVITFFHHGAVPELVLNEV